MNRFRISPDGQLSFEDAYHLRSNDYYSSRNYASRLIGNRLIYYTPLYLGHGGDDPLDALPGCAPLGTDASTARIPPHRRRAPGLYRAAAARRRRGADRGAAQRDQLRSHRPGARLRRHRRARPRLAHFLRLRKCGLSVGRRLARRRAKRRRRAPTSTGCPSRAGRGRRRSARAAPRPTNSPSARMPRAGRIDVLVALAGRRRRDVAARDQQRRRRPAAGAVPAFGDGSEEAAGALYRDLPAPRGTGLRSSRTASSATMSSTAMAAAATARAAQGWRRRRAGARRPGAIQLAAAHGVERIEVHRQRRARGRRRRRRTSASPRSICRGASRASATATSTAARQGEAAATPSSSAPIRAAATAPRARSACRSPRRSRPHITAISAAPRRCCSCAATSAASAPPASSTPGRPTSTDDGCQASCVDWYGNARPIFMRRPRLRPARLRAGRGPAGGRTHPRARPHQFRAAHGAGGAAAAIG